ncbi:MAG: glutamate carboxypeptidase [Solirubrobacteraceae bacterium]|jgi:glutamate carboxypeptidase|nr:glutamate carboxypeptidase [Solirubrobacteraceae bacterium]
MHEWIAEAAEAIAARAPKELGALVAISSPSGDVDGAEEAIAYAQTLAPSDAAVEREPCSTADHAEDLIVRVQGTGSSRLVLVGHVDTVIGHDDHQPLKREGELLRGSGTVDMKGGVILSLGVLRSLAERRETFAEVALLLVCDEEWRAGDFVHTERFAGFDACLCFEGGELTPGGDEAVVVKRKAAGTLQVIAHGKSAHSGANPDDGANALLALAQAAQTVAERHDPAGPQHLTAVPTVVHCGDAFNVVPAAGELLCDLRADGAEAFDTVLHGLPGHVDGVRLEGAMQRCWPGMDAREATAALLQSAAARLGRPVIAAERGGASDASYLAQAIDVCVDGLGPLGGQAHAPGEYIVEASLRTRAEVALALADAVLGE